MCPKGDDPLTIGQVDEVQHIAMAVTHASVLSTSTGDFTITYDDNFGASWTTRPIPFCSGLVCGSLAYPDASDTLDTTATLASDQLSTVDDFYVDMQIQFIGDACGTTTLHPITGYVASTGVVTFTTSAAAANCGVGTSFKIVDSGTATANDADGITVLGAGVADAYVGAAISMGGDTGCTNFASVITGYTAGKVASTADASTCSRDGTYEIIQGASPATIKKALLDLPNEVIRDVDVSLAAVSQSGIAVTMTYAVTFKNPANNNGRLLKVGLAGCNKAGCAPQYRGIAGNRGVGNRGLGIGTGTTTLSVLGADHCGWLTARGSQVSNDANSRVIASYVVTIAASGTPDTFAVARNGGAASTAAAIDGTAQSVDCGLTLTFSSTTDAEAGDSWTFNIGSTGAGSIYSGVIVSTTGTKEAAECANRGSCDGETGVCNCFPGHTDEDCSIQSSLA
jgi:hypothetical protein